MESDEPLTKEELMKDEYYGLILPDNKRVNDKIRKKMEEEKRRKEEERKRKQKIDDATNQKNLKQKKEEEERERLRLEMESAQLNYERFEESVKNGEGNLNEIFRTILNNTSSYELAFPNYNMEDGWDFRLLMTILERNTSLLTLSLSRKNLGDTEAEKLAGMLEKNHKLRRLELEGNFFGPKAASFFAKALKKNNTLRYLDLENNNLTDKGKDISGIRDLFEGLQQNTMLISLNVANNYLTKEVGHFIVGCLRKNKTIINLEFFQNKDFGDRPNNNNTERKDDDSKFISNGLHINNIVEIKELLKNNNDAYNKMRTDEWKERKRMTSNYEDTVDTQVKIETRKILEETRKKEREDIEMLYLNNFNENVKKMEEDFLNRVNQYYAETKERLSKKKKKGKKKKK
jgi:hypothetical protein